MTKNHIIVAIWLSAVSFDIARASSLASGNLRIPFQQPQLELVTSTYWYEAQDHIGAPKGYAPFTTSNPATYPVYRNVKDFGAKGDGSTFDSDAIQLALNAIDAQGHLNRYEAGGGAWMARPAQVYVPGGTYIINKNIDFRINTIMVGDPNDKPVFKASADFKDAQMIQGQDFAQPKDGGQAPEPTKEFFMAIKNIIFDTTAVGDNNDIAAIQWGVSQATQLTNLEFLMPNGTLKHFGIDINGGSLTGFNDLTFRGGSGIRFGNQQASLKGMTFIGCHTGILINNAFVINIQGAHFDTCGLAVDASSGGIGGVVLLDSTILNTGLGVRLLDSSPDNAWHSNQIVIENLQFGGNTHDIVQDTNGKTLLPFSAAIDTWVWGNYIHSGTGRWANPLTTIKTPRPSTLLVNGKYFTMSQPTYADYDSSRVVNVKSVSGLPVKGDGNTDDSPNLNKILAQNAQNGKLSYFPYGVYAVKDTLVIPAGSRIVGEAWPVIMASGTAFGDQNNPKTVVQVGNVGGDVGIAQIQDMRFTVGDIMPGAKILEVNIAGTSPGDVGFWNTHVTVGGTKESAVNSAQACLGEDTSKCKAAWGMIHLTANSGAYIENMWGWVSDHDLDPGAGYPNRIAVGRGILVEATKGTWLTGTGMEHNVLYNYNFNNAQNVFAGMLQTETAYWQGTSQTPTAPAPFFADSRYGDPDFAWCKGGDAPCRMTLGQNINGGSNIFLYATGDWAFFQNNQGCSDCVVNHARVSSSPTNLYWYIHSVLNAETMIFDGQSNPPTSNNPGPWAGLIAAYLQFT